MCTDTDFNTAASTIANSIVELVERTDGPVTLACVAREIPGFAEDDPPTHEYFVNHGQQEMLIWDGMTEAGCAALRMVMAGRRVAVQYVNPLPYIVENCGSGNENWQPIVLLPKSAGNLDTRNWLMRASPGFQKYAMTRATKEGLTEYRPITPRPGSFMSDRFAL